jgi:hypothetical protein
MVAGDSATLGRRSAWGCVHSEKEKPPGCLILSGGKAESTLNYCSDSLIGVDFAHAIKIQKRAALGK